MRGPPPSKKSTGEREIMVPQLVQRKPLDSLGTSSAPDLTSSQPENVRPDSSPISDLAATPGRRSIQSSTGNRIQPVTDPAKLLPLVNRSLRPESASDRPPLSRHTSTQKFSSRPVPITRVATEDGPGPSIMFTNTPSPPIRTSRLPSAYKSNVGDRITETPESSNSQTHNRSSYFTQAVPLSFNDLPSRAQHLILNELMRNHSKDTAVIFTTLPSPTEGTCQSEEASSAYLSDLEVLCNGCPPVLMVHSNSMTVTMSL